MNKKRLAGTVGAVALTAVIAIGGTLAYLSQTTEVAKNVFTGSPDVDITVEEDKWNETGKNDASNYTPGKAIAKDPRIQIQEGSADTWVGARLDFVTVGADGQDSLLPYGTAGSQEGFQAYASHDGINVGWTLIARNNLGGELYAYGTKLDQTNQTTGTIFDSITVNAGITTVKTTMEETLYTKTVTKENGVIVKEELTAISGTPSENTVYYDKDGNICSTDKLPEFRIDVKGFAIQGADVTLELAKAEIIKLANNNVDNGSDAYFNAVS